MQYQIIATIIVVDQKGKSQKMRKQSWRMSREDGCSLEVYQEKNGLRKMQNLWLLLNKIILRLFLIIIADNLERM